jgi:serine/threonine protein kinase
LYRERIEASYDIASALYYLHTKNIVFRDLVSTSKWSAATCYIVSIH